MGVEQDGRGVSAFAGPVDGSFLRRATPNELKAVALHPRRVYPG